ncbi:hypothetical protein [Magnetofaba australis]|uniref:hypothetical protein n=1 Tax=Magnetofaba australis TaxID=1472297 RepID=UPI000A19D9F6|nr:hypothetical protein [Magnetofaba australis]
MLMQTPNVTSDAKRQARAARWRAAKEQSGKRQKAVHLDERACAVMAEYAREGLSQAQVVEMALHLLGDICDNPNPVAWSQSARDIRDQLV